MIRIIIYPSAVQGADAAREIATAIDTARARREVDALLVCRGGGAAEDLWSFNEEVVARAVARFQAETGIPVVSGVGHETDFTICDFAADVRAPTPTAAAELLSPDTIARRGSLQQQYQQLHRRLLQLLGHRQQRIDLARRGLVSPVERLSAERARLIRTQLQLRRGLDHLVATQRHRVQVLAGRLGLVRPDVLARRLELDHLCKGLQRARARAQDNRTRLLTGLGQALSLLNPQHVLNRGYVMVTQNGPKQALLTSVAKLKPADRVQLRFRDGTAEAHIVATAEPRIAAPNAPDSDP